MMAISTDPPLRTEARLPNNDGTTATKSFSLAAFEQEFSGILFDMDGTLIDSTMAIVKHWEGIGAKFGIDPSVILATSHGRRSIDVFKEIDPKHATWEYVSSLEDQIPRLYGSSAREIPGARSLLASIQRLSLPWAIVTSGTRPLVEGWLQILELSHPKHIVTAEDVENGKPDPACYSLGAAKLKSNCSPTKSLKEGALNVGRPLVIEDAPAGIRAGRSAGLEVLALATTHSVDDLAEAGASWVVRNLESVSVRRGVNGEVVMEIRDALEKAVSE